MATDPLPVLLDCYERYGPVFSVRILHSLNAFLLGPEANHHVLVSNAANFRWREGGFGELEPLLGDGCSRSTAATTGGPGGSCCRRSTASGSLSPPTR